MKKTFLLLAVAALLSLTSCKYEIHSHGNRNSLNLRAISNSLMEMTQELPMACVFQAFRVEEFINSTPEEQMKPEFYDFNYSADGENFIVSLIYTITTGGRDLFEPGAEWTVTCTEHEELGFVKIKCIDFDRFTVSGKSAVSTDTYANYSFNLTLDGFDLNGKPYFTSNVKGDFHEKDSAFTADIKDLGGMHYSWMLTNFEGNLYYQMVITNSVFSVRFLENGQERDWFNIIYNDFGKVTYECSVKDDYLRGYN